MAQRQSRKVPNPVNIPPNEGYPNSIQNNNRVYILGYNPLTGYSFVARPANPDPSMDGPLEMRVDMNCTLVIQLQHYENLDWEFDTDAIQIDRTAQTRYFNLVKPTWTDAQGNEHCTQIFFYATYLDQAAPNEDLFNIYVKIDGVSKLIDPDIKNPGDGTQGIPPELLRSTRQEKH